MKQEVLTRYMVISDIHGSSSAFKAVMKRYKREQATHLLIAGDITARHSETLARDLNSMRNHITAVQGNCDTSWEEQVLRFPIPTFVEFKMADRTIFLTHGNLMTPSRPPVLPPGSIFVSGHTHRPDVSFLPDPHLYLLNPGSIAFPRGDNPPSYGIITEKGLEVRDLYHSRLLHHISFKK